MTRDQIKARLLGMLTAGQMPVREVKTKLFELGATKTTMNVALREVLFAGYIEIRGDHYHLRAGVPEGEARTVVELAQAGETATKAKRVRKPKAPPAVAPAAPETVPPPPPAEDWRDEGRCVPCGGTGLKAGGYCHCPLGPRRQREDKVAGATPVTTETKTETTAATVAEVTETTQGGNEKMESDVNATKKVTKKAKGKTSKRLAGAAKKAAGADTKPGTLSSFREAITGMGKKGLERAALVASLVKKHGPKAKWATLNYISLAKKGKLADCPKLHETEGRLTK